MTLNTILYILRKIIQLLTVANELIYESRIDNKYRVIWKYENNQVILLLLTGNHNIVEGKK